MPLTLAAAIPTVAIVGAFAHMSRTGEQVRFYWANVLGGVVLSIYNFIHTAYASLALNVAFAVFAVAGLRRLGRDRRGQRGEGSPSSP